MSGAAASQQVALDDNSGQEGLAGLFIDDRYSDVFATVLQALPDRFLSQPNFNRRDSFVTACFQALASRSACLVMLPQSARIILLFPVQLFIVSLFYFCVSFACHAQLLLQPCRMQGGLLQVCVCVFARASALSVQSARCGDLLFASKAPATGTC
jgi:hypothetical protein